MDGLTRALAAGPGTEVRLGQFDPSDWLEVSLFGPYTQPEAVHRCVGLEARAVSTHGIESREDIVLAVFRFPDGAFESVALGREAADFGPEAVDKRYQRAEARFQVRVPAPRSWGRLAPVGGAGAACP